MTENKSKKAAGQTESKDKNLKGKFKRLLPFLICIAVFSALLITLNAIRKKENIAEFFTLKISKYVVSTMARITSVLPFSVYEWLIVFLIVFLVFFVVIQIIRLCKKRFYKVIKGFLSLGLAALVILNVYVATAGFAYYRKPLDIPLSETVYKDQDVIDISSFFLDDFIYLSGRMERDEKNNVISPYSMSKLADIMTEEFKRLDSSYFYSYTPSAKGMVFSRFMTIYGFTGVTFMPLGEANVNKIIPSSDIPQTMAHELAHSKGVMREYEANLLSYYILLTSENEYLRYCGYFSTFQSLYSMAALGNNYDWDIADALYGQLPEEIKEEYTNSYMFWWNYPGFFEEGPFKFLGDFGSFISSKIESFGNWFNNLYLKSNGAEDGTGSYDNPWDTDEVEWENPDTGEIEIIIEPIYSNIHKIFFSIYESRNDTKPKTSL